MPGMDPCRPRRIGGFPALIVTLQIRAEKLCVTLLFCAKCKRKCVTGGKACPSIPSPKKNGLKAIDGDVAGIQTARSKFGEEAGKKAIAKIASPVWQTGSTTIAGFTARCFFV